MKKVLQAILHILGFPALIGVIVYSNIDIIKGGVKSYGVFVFVGIILVVVFALIYLLVVALMAKNAKKKGKTNVYHQTFVAMIMSFVMLGGFWIGLDLGLPDLLADATSNTIYYEDLADNYYARSVVNEELLKEYIRRNVANGNLKSLTLEQYQEQGVSNAEVAKLIEVHFASIDKAGYATINGTNLDLALGDRMTTSVIVHLLLDTRVVPEIEYYLYDSTTGTVDTSSVNWNVLDMLGTPMDITDIEMMGDEGYEEFLTGLGSTGNLLRAIYPDAESFRTFVAGLINGIVPDITEGITTSPIYIGFDDTSLQLVPSNESRGVLDYQSMGWLDSNGLIYAIVTLFSTRKLFLIWAGVLVLTNFLIGMLRGMGRELKDKENRLSDRRPNNNGGYNGYNNGNYGYTQNAPTNYYGGMYPYQNSNGYIPQNGNVRRYDMNNFR